MLKPAFRQAASIKESWRAFAANALNEHAGKKVLVVTSNGIARFAPVLLDAGESFGQRNGLKIATGALCIFTHENGIWQCDTWNLCPDKLEG